MFSKVNSTQIDTIDLKYTDEELAHQKELLQTLLNAVSIFLDEEETLGFLNQKYVDLIICLENMLQDLLSKKSNISLLLPQKKDISLTYFTSDDNSDDDIRTQRKKIQPEA